MSKYQWCIKCTELGDDFIGIITDQANFIEGIEDSTCALLDSLDSIKDHPSRCKACRSNEYCEDLLAMAYDSGVATQDYYRVIRNIKR